MYRASADGNQIAWTGTSISLVLGMSDYGNARILHPEYWVFENIAYVNAFNNIPSAHLSLFGCYLTAVTYW